MGSSGKEETSPRHHDYIHAGWHLRTRTSTSPRHHDYIHVKEKDDIYNFLHVPQRPPLLHLLLHQSFTETRNSLQKKKTRNSKEARTRRWGYWNLITVLLVPSTVSLTTHPQNARWRFIPQNLKQLKYLAMLSECLLWKRSQNISLLLWGMFSPKAARAIVPRSKEFGVRYGFFWVFWGRGACDLPPKFRNESSCSPKTKESYRSDGLSVVVGVVFFLLVSSCWYMLGDECSRTLQSQAAKQDFPEPTSSLGALGAQSLTIPPRGVDWLASSRAYGASAPVHWQSQVQPSGSEPDQYDWRSGSQIAPPHKSPPRHFGSKFWRLLYQVHCFGNFGNSWRILTTFLGKAQRSS